MPVTTPIELDWTNAPSVLEGARTLDLTAEGCDLPYWLDQVAGRMLPPLQNGHSAGAEIPERVLEPGPLREALIEEFAFRSIAEDKAARALGHLVALAPDSVTMEFFSTQLLDEARHARVFRDHLVEVGIRKDELTETIERVAGPAQRSVLDPLEEFGLSVVTQKGDFYGGVLVLTVLVEGVLAPFGELSERKWALLDQAAAEIERGAGIDEIRHLAVGSALIRSHLEQHPEERGRLLALLLRGRNLWEKLPMVEVLSRRESLFQQGIEEHSAALDDYQVWEGRRLVDTTAQERMITAAAWSKETQDQRLRHMLLPEAVL